MYNQNSQHPKGLCPPMSPRISFSNDFAESSHSRHQHQTPTPRDAPVSSDFEFSVTNDSMMSADELFFKGRLLPFKDSCTNQFQKTTLRDELLAGEDDGGGSGNGSLRPPKGGSTRWRGFLGLRKSHIGSKKSDKISDGSVGKTSQYLLKSEHPTRVQILFSKRAVGERREAFTIVDALMQQNDGGSS